MILAIDHLKFNLEFDQQNINTKTPIIFLHGFTGNLNDWKFLKDKLQSDFTPIFIDLIGHGNTSSPDNVKFYTSEFQVKILKEIFEKLRLEKMIIVGYSMGGRLALDFSFEHPQFIKALVLESTSFGLETKEEQKERIKNDTKLAEEIKNSTIEKFINYWQNIQLFDSQKKILNEILQEVKKVKIKTNNSVGLINSLIGFSTGKMKNYFELTSKFNFPILLITGDLDEKFTNIARKINPLLKNSEIKIVNDTGHNIHLEKPEEFLKLLNTFLVKLEK